MAALGNLRTSIRSQGSLGSLGFLYTEGSYLLIGTNNSMNYPKTLIILICHVETLLYLHVLQRLRCHHTQSARLAIKL